MKRTCRDSRWLALAVLAACLCCAPRVDAQSTSTATGLWFTVGETLTYKINWGVPVGDVVMTTRWVEENGQPLLAIKMRTRSNKFLSTFYPVDDTVESFLDPVTFLPVRFTKVLNEGTYKCDRLTTFDRTNKVARFETEGSAKGEEFAIPEDARDVMSFMYAMRRRRFSPGQTERFQVVDDGKIHDLTVKTVAYEDVKLPRLGKTRSVRIEPEAGFQGLFVRTGKITLWVSDDERRVLTQLTAKAPIGNFKAVLVDVKP